MFIKVKAENGLCNLKGECYFSEYTPIIAVNADEIIAVWDKYTFNERITYVRISMTNGREFECEDSFEDLKKKLGDKFVKFNVESDIDEGTIEVLVSKKNILYINPKDRMQGFKTEIIFKDLMGKSLFVQESVDEVIERLI